MIAAHSTIALAALRVTALALWVGLALGCEPHAIVLTQASPNPLVGQKTFAVAPVAFAPALRVGGKIEDAYLVGKSPADVKAWHDAKDAFNARFDEVLAQQRLLAPGAAFTVRATVKVVEPGFDVVVWNAPGEVEVEVEIVDAAGNEIDRLGMRTRGEGFNVIQRVGSCGFIAGALVAEYLHKRMR